MDYKSLNEKIDIDLFIRAEYMSYTFGTKYYTFAEIKMIYDELIKRKCIHYSNAACHQLIFEIEQQLQSKKSLQKQPFHDIIK